MTVRRWLILIALVVLAWLASRGREDRAPTAPGPEPAGEPRAESPSSPDGSGDPEPKSAGEPPTVDRAPIPDDGVSDFLTNEMVDPGEPPAGGGTSAVLVVDDRGRPVVGASVSSRRGSSVTDERGIAWIPHIRGDISTPSKDRRARTISVKAPGFVTVNVKGHNRSPCEVIRLATRGGTLAGTCVDEAGVPLAGITIRSDNGWWDPGVTVVTDESGRFETDRAPRRRMALSVWSARLRSVDLVVVPPQKDIVITAIPSEEPRRPWDSPPAPARREPPRVDQGDPGPEILITARGGDDHEPLWAGFANGEVRRLVPEFATTGKPLSVRLPREDLLWLGLGRFPAATQKDLPVGTREVSLSIREDADVTGRLVDRRGRPVEEGWLVFRWPGSREMARSMNLGGGYGPHGSDRGRRGRFTMTGVGPGRFDIAWASLFLKEDVVVKRNVRMPEKPEDLDVGTLVIRPTETTLRVVVTDEERRPVEGAVVTLWIDRSPAAARTDSRGEIEFPLYDRTGFAIEVAAKGFPTKRTRTSTDDIPSLIEVRLERRAQSEGEGAEGLSQREQR